MQLKEIKRNGQRLIKYKLNVADTKHVFLYKVKDLYYSFIMIEGVLVNVNDKEIKTQEIKGTKKRPKYFNEWYKSSLNSYYNSSLSL